MRRFLALALLAPLAATEPRAAPEARAVSLAVSPACCEITFTAYAFGLFPIQGRFAAFTGRLVLDPASPAASHAAAEILAASLSLDGGPIEADVKAPHFLDVERHPLILFDARGADAAAGTVTGAGAGRLHGLLTIRGVTRPVSLSLAHDGSQVRAEATISRSAFGITARPVLAGDTVAIRVTAPLPR